MAQTTTFGDLEKATCCLLQIIKDTPELDKNTKVAIAGDMAVQKYLPNSRQQFGAGQSIDLITNSGTSASLLRKKLLHHPMSPLTESSDRLLYYQTSPPTSPPPTSAPAARSRSAGIEVRITPEMLCPFLPGAAKLVHEITPSPDQLPYISLNDLIVFKMDACGLRDSAQGKQQEARDAALLLEVATEHCALDLNQDQARVVDECLADILRHSAPDRQNKAWWQARLMGKCDPDARKEAKEVLSDMIQSMSLNENNNNNNNNNNKRTSGDEAAADGKRWSLNLSNRTSSSSSKTSLDSMASGFSSGASSFSTCSSPTTTNGTNSPDLPRSPRSPHDLTCAMPQRPRKFSTSQHSPTKGHARKKSTADKGGSKRHSQILGGLPSGGIAQIAQLLDDSSSGSPGLTLTARFESTPEVDHGFSNNGSYF